MKGDLTLLSAVDAADHIRAGRLASEALVSACLARIEATDDTIKAWAYLDGNAALNQAREMDRIRKAGHAVGPLHGVPVGLKDIIDTCDMPSVRGSSVFEGRQTDTDATIVERLREALAAFPESGLGIVATIPAHDEIDIAGGAMFLIGNDPKSCEFSTTVSADYGGQGLGHALMSTLIAAAKQRGMHEMEGFVLSKNQPMLKLAARLGFSTSADPDDGSVRICRLRLA